MRTLTYQLRDLKKVTIEIGFEGENNRTQVRIDCGEVFAEYPNAEAAMKVQAPKGGIYPATVTRDGDMILWTVRDCDVANKGNGEFQLTFTDGETVVKTCPGKIHIDRSLKGSGTAPSGVQDWIERAEEALEGVEAAEIHQPMIGLDGYWYKWDQEAQQYVSTNVKAQGQDGKGIASIAKTGTSGNVDTYTITFTDGTTTTYTVTNSETVIDDTTPASDKVFSSEKVDTELNTVKSDLQSIEDNVKIEATSEKKYFHNGKDITSLVVYGNDDAFNPIHLADKKNYIPKLPVTSLSDKGVDVEFHGRYLEIKGTANGSGSFRPDPQWVDAAIPAGTYILYMYFDGSFTATDNPWIDLYTKNSVGTETKIKTAYFNHNPSRTYSNITVTESVKFLCTFNLTNTFVSENGLKVWIGLFPSGVTITNTETTVSAGSTETVEIDSSLYPNGVDTVQHESVSTYHPTVQSYIDNMQMDINEELTYVTPEAFGAIGDGAADDATAINACIAYAIAKKVAVRAYKQYKATQSINISGDYCDIFINYLNYTGTGNAVIFQCRWSNIRFGTIVSSGNGIYVAALTTNVLYNTITVDRIAAVYDGVLIYASMNCYQNKLIFNFITAGSAYSCIHVTRDNESQTGYVNEWTYQGGLLTGGLWGIRGFLGTDSHINVHTENLGSSGSGGAIYSESGIIPSIDYIRTGEIVLSNYILKVSGEVSRTTFPPRIALGATLESIDITELEMPQNFVDSDNIHFVTDIVVQKEAQSNVTLTKNLTFWGNRFQFPQFKYIECHITDDMDMTDQYYKGIIPQKFYADTVNARVDLHPTYAANCLNTFTVVQSDGYELDIYDCEGNLIFDGSANGNGTFKLTASIDGEGTLNFDLSNQEWTIEKIA